MQTNIPVCCCKAKGKFDLVLPTQKSSIFHLKSAGAQANISSLMLTPTPHLLLGWKFPNKVISAVPSLVSPEIKSESVSSPQSNVLSPALVIVILGSKTQQNPKQWQNTLFCKVSLCPETCSKPCSFEAVPRERARHKTTSRGEEKK